MIQETLKFKKQINCKEINYADEIYHHTYIQFDFLDRIRILFNGYAHIVSQIYTKEQANIAGSEGQTFTKPIIKRKNKVVGLSSSNNTINKN